MDIFRVLVFFGIFLGITRWCLPIFFHFNFNGSFEGGCQEQESTAAWKPIQPILACCTPNFLCRLAMHTTFSVVLWVLDALPVFLDAFWCFSYGIVTTVRVSYHMMNMMSYDVIWCHMMSYDVIWCHMSLKLDPFGHFGLLPTRKHLIISYPSSSLPPTIRSTHQSPPLLTLFHMSHLMGPQHLALTKQGPSRHGGAVAKSGEDPLTNPQNPSDS